MHSFIDRSALIILTIFRCLWRHSVGLYVAEAPISLLTSVFKRSAVAPCPSSQLCSCWDEFRPGSYSLLKVTMSTRLGWWLTVSYFIESYRLYVFHHPLWKMNWSGKIASQISRLYSRTRSSQPSSEPYKSSNISLPCSAQIHHLNLACLNFAKASALTRCVDSYSVPSLTIR